MAKAKKKSKHYEFVDNWCLEHEMLPENLDDDYVIKAQLAYQRVVRLIPGREHFSVKYTKTFNNWCWRTLTIQHFIGQEGTFQLFLLLMLHNKYDFMTYSYLLSKTKWHSLEQDIMETGEGIYQNYHDLLVRHTVGMANGTLYYWDFPVEATFLETFLSSTLSSESNPEDEGIHDMLSVDHDGLVDNYPALFTSVLLLHLYCLAQGEERPDAKIIQSCKRATSRVLYEQPGAYKKSFREITPVCV